MRIRFLAFCLLSVSLIYSQTIDTVYEMEEVVIQSDRISVPFNKANRSIQIIKSEELQNIPARDLAGVLQFAAGVDVRQRGLNGVQSDIGIRGGNFEQTLVLLNGVKMTDPQTSHHVMNLPVSLENIERIEIIKGPAARIYGQNAFAGAINIVTKSPDDLSASANASIGQNQLLSGGIELSFPNRKANHYLSLDRNVSQGYRYNTDYDITNLYYQSDFKIGANGVKFTGGLTERRFGANGFYASPDFRDQYEEILTSFIAMQTTIIRNNWIVKPRLYWRRNEDEYVFVRSNPSLYRNLHIGNTIGLELNSSYSNIFGTSGIGLELRSEHLISNNLGRRNRNIVNSFFEHRIEKGSISLTPGVSFHYFSDFGPRFFYGIDGGYQLSLSSSIYGNIGTTYRVPSFTDRFYSDPANEGNEYLEPEEAITYEIGFQKTHHAYQLQSAIFRRTAQNLIDWTRDTLISPKWMPNNIANVTMNGFEISLKADARSISGFTSLGVHNFSYTYIGSQLTPIKGKESRYLLQNLRHQFLYSSTFNLKSVNLNFSFRYFDRVNLEDYQLIDIRLSRTFTKWKVYLDVNNILDQEYKETNLVKMPGRWMVLGTTYKII